MGTSSRQSAAAARNRIAGGGRVAAAKTRSLVRINSAAIRKKAVTGCRQAQKKYAAAVEEWERFQASDEPEYARAVAVGLGPLREETRSLLLTFHELADLFQEVEEEQFFSGDALAVCLARVEANRAEEARAAAEAEASGVRPEDVADGEEDDPDGWDGNGGDDSAAGDNPFEDFDDDPGAEYEQAWEETVRRMLGMPPRSAAHRADPGRGDRAERIKELYRDLARSLHPDAGGDATPAQLRLWHEVQDAYRSGDLARLEFLHTRCGSVSEWESPVTPVSRLHALAGVFKNALRDLRRRIRSVKQQPAWGFSLLSAAERQRHVLHLEGLLKKDRAELKHRIGVLQAELQKLRAESERLRQAQEARQARQRSRDEARPSPQKRRERFSQGDLFGL